MRKYLIGVLIALGTITCSCTVAEASVWDTGKSEELLNLEQNPKALELIDGQWNWNYSVTKKSYFTPAAVYPSEPNFGPGFYMITNAKFYWFGDNTITTSTGDSWYAPKPKPPRDLYGHTRASVNMWNFGQIPSKDNFGFWSSGAFTYWEGEPTDKPRWDKRIGQYVKDVNANYFRRHTKPSSGVFSITGEDYKNGSDYWVKPTTELQITNTSIGNIPGKKKMVLNDYGAFNQLSYTGNYGNAVIPCWESPTTSNNAIHKSRKISKTYSNPVGTEHVGGRAKDYTTTFGVTINQDGFDTTSISTQEWAKNNMFINTDRTGHGRIRVDGVAPTFSNINFDNDYNYLNVNLNVDDARSGVNRKKGGERTAVYVYPKGQPNYSFANIWNVNHESGSRHARANIPLGETLGNYAGVFTIEFTSIDNVGNRGNSQKFDLDRGKPTIETESIEYGGGFRKSINGKQHMIYGPNAYSSISINAVFNQTGGTMFGRPDFGVIGLRGLGNSKGFSYSRGDVNSGVGDWNNTGWNNVSSSTSTYGATHRRNNVSAKVNHGGSSEAFEVSAFGGKRFNGSIINGQTKTSKYLGVDRVSPNVTLEMTSNLTARLLFSDDYSGAGKYSSYNIGNRNLFNSMGHSFHVGNKVNANFASMGFSDMSTSWDKNKDNIDDLRTDIYDEVNNFHSVVNTDVPFYADDIKHSTTPNSKGVLLNASMNIHNSHRGVFMSNGKTEGSIKVIAPGGKQIVHHSNYIGSSNRSVVGFNNTQIADTTHGPVAPSIKFDPYNFTFHITHTKDINQSFRILYETRTRFGTKSMDRNFAFQTGNKYTKLVIKNPSGKVMDTLIVNDNSGSIHMNRLPNGKYVVESTSYDHAGNPSPTQKTNIDLSWFTEDNYPVEITAIKDVKHKGIKYPIEVGEKGSYYGSKSGQIKPKQGYYIDYRIKIPYHMLFTFDQYDVTVEHMYHQGTDKNKKVKLTAPPNTPSLNAEGVFSYPVKRKGDYLYGKLWIPPHAIIDKTGDIGATLKLEFLRKGAAPNDEANVRKQLPLVLFDTTSTSLQDIEVDKQR